MALGMAALAPPDAGLHGDRLVPVTQTGQGHAVQGIAEQLAEAVVGDIAHAGIYP